jgi:MoaA/NifB/PqqE/SkfB family radical SAM enzyme
LSGEYLLEEGNTQVHNGKGEYARSLRVKNVYIEMTNICNFDCNFCPIRSSKRKPGRIELDLFKKIIDEIAATGLTQRIGFHVLGEPMLHPELPAAVAYCSERGLETSLATNGSLLSRDKVRALIDSGLDYLGISLETTDAAEHESRRASLDFPSYYRQILEAVADFRRNSPVQITLSLMNTVTKRFFTVDGDIGVNRKETNLKEKLAGLIFDLKGAIGQTQSREEIARELKNVKVNSSRYIKIDDQIKLYVQMFWDWGNAFTSRKVYPASIGYCGYAGKRIGILYDGSVNLCCGDYDGGTTIGNVKDHSLIELLESERMRNLMAGFERNRVLHPYCRRCLGATSRTMALIKGISTILLFKLKGHPLDGAKKTSLSQR